MYVKDSVIEAQIEKDLKKHHLEGRIIEIEHQLLLAKDKSHYSGLKERLEKLKGELELLSD